MSTHPKEKLPPALKALRASLRGATEAPLRYRTPTSLIEFVN